MMERLTALFDRRPATAEDWLARMGRPRVGARDRDAFLIWLEADAARLEQYERAKAEAAMLEGLRGAFSGDLAHLRRNEGRRAAPRRRVLAGGLAAAGIAAAVVVAPQLAMERGRLYESPAGRVVDVALDDGSRLTLDAGSVVRVDLARDVRRVTLVRGAVAFDVAHDASHPFQVGVGDRRVIVTGTRFVAAFTGQGAEVSLLEGRVAIGRRDAARADALDGALVLTPGERASFRPDAPAITKVRANVEAATAWRERRLIFDNAPLSEVIAAAERYAPAPLVADDPALGDIRVTAILPLEGDGPLVDRMAALLPISTRKAADGRILIRAE